VPVIAALAWPIWERIHIAGDFAVSPHGIFVAIGFVLGAQILLRRAQRRGVARRHVERIPDLVSALVTRAAIGGIVGARLFYVLNNLDSFSDPIGWFTVWEGGLSLLGGITGAVLAGVPYVVKRRLSVPLLLDSVASGLAFGIFIGRIGDLIIGEHLGGRTDFVLGWRCSGAVGDPAAPYPWPGIASDATYQGCFDAAVHQTALYDLMTGGIVFAMLVLLGRRPRFDGFFMAAFVVLYGSGRFISDFARPADLDLVGPLTGSQLAALGAIVAVAVWFLVGRPDRRQPYAWSPPDYDRPWDHPETEPQDGEDPVERGDELPSHADTGGSDHA